MSLLKGFKANKAITTLMESDSMHASECREAVSTLKKLGPAAINKLIDALADCPKNSAVEQLLGEMLNDKTLSLYVDGLTDPNNVVVAGVMRILATQHSYDANRLYELFDDPEVPKNVLVQILLTKKKTLKPNILLGMLDKVSKNVRQLIFRVLEEIATEDSLPQLLKYASSDDPSTRLHIIRTISRFSHPKAADALLAALRDSHKVIRQAALEGIARSKANISPQHITPMLRDPDLTVQSKAIEALIQRRHPDTVKHLIDILQDDSEYVRRAAVEVLNEISDPRAIKDLLTAMKDKDWWVKVRAADALGSIGGPKVVEAVLTLIKDKDEFLRRSAIEILNAIKDERAYDYLVEALNDADWWVRERAADALAGLNDKRAIGPLINMIKQHPESSGVAIQAIIHLDDKSAIRPLLEQLHKAEPSAQKDILNALSMLADDSHQGSIEGAVTRLIQSTSDQAVREAAEATMHTMIARVAPTSSSQISHPSISESSNEMMLDLANTTNARHEVMLIDPEALSAGEILADRYRVIKKVGKGAFGVVLLVEDQMVNEEIILKFLNPHMASDDSVIKRFVQELRYARRITHKNVIRIFDFLTFGRSNAISMEYFKSHSLSYEMHTNKSWNFKRAIKIFIEICEGLHVAHSVDVVHRDIKPANILIGENDVVKVVDFGLAAAASQTDSRITKSGLLVGTPTYMAPEQIRAKKIDRRTDIYSLGIMMYELFTGAPPYKGEDHMATLFKHIDGKATPAREKNPKIPAALNDIIMKAMAKNPEDRYQSIDSLEKDLQALYDTGSH
ncbi:MAG: HEAT repeat domain-containing protein [Gammaproteobacteria bacterium]